MNTDIEFHIKLGYTWAKLPGNVRQLLGNSQSEYDTAVLNYSIKNQLIHRGNLVKQVCKDQKRYYEMLLQHSRENLMLYPYHLSDFMVRGLRVTPFAYYHQMMRDIMTQEKSYDSLPNFTAADGVRLLGIGRNQYIDLMNATRSSKVIPKLFQVRKKPVKDLLPAVPVEDISIEPWWLVKVSFISDEDVKRCRPEEKELLDQLIAYNTDTKKFKLAGSLDCKLVLGLYRKGFVYLDVPITDSDTIVVPPLEGFVMNRVLGDYFETLLYKIFVSIDEHTSVSELAQVLEIDAQLVKNAVSVYCRLGFAKKKNCDLPTDDLHPSWTSLSPEKRKESGDLLIDWDEVLDLDDSDGGAVTPDAISVSDTDSSTAVSSMVTSVEGSGFVGSSSATNHAKRVAFLFDSTLTAFLMMGNLSPGLKNHAVTMFEVGKLNDETMDSFVAELEKVGNDAEGEAQRYFDHALTLRETVLFLRHNKGFPTNGNPLGLDLLRCESLLGLDPQVCRKVLNKNYEILISMAPLSNEVKSITSCSPQHLGPSIPEVSSVWFKLYIYHITGNGPPSILLPRGAKIKKLPNVFSRYERVQITTWGHDPSILPISNIMMTLHDCLSHSAVFLQAYSLINCSGEAKHISFPISPECEMGRHPAITKLSEQVDLTSNCGYVSLLNSRHRDAMEDEEKANQSMSFDNWNLLECCFGIPLFDATLNKEICSKIIAKNLLEKASLQKLLESSRILSLELLDFIAANQDLPVIGESANEGYMIPSNASSDQTVPLPTKTLFFNGTTLEV